MLDDHIKECDECLDEIMRLQRLDMNLTELKDVEAGLSEDLTGAILSELPANIKRAGRGYGHHFFSATTLLSTVTVVLAVLVFILAGKVDQISITSKAPKPKSVKIMFFSEKAQNVSLVGDFNAWGVDPLLLSKVNGNTWEAEVKLAPGMYQYNLVVDGKKWIANPNSKSLVPDGFGGTNSVVIVNDNGGKQIESVGKQI